MGYYCSYTVHDGKKKTNYFGSACYSSCYSSIGNQGFDKVDIYVLKEYQSVGATDSNSMKFNDKDVYDYTIFLKRCGFYVTMVEDTFQHGSIKVPCYRFTVYCHLNTGIGNLMLLNAIRYLHENTGVEVAKAFLHLGRARKGPHYMNRLLISHNGNPSRQSGHVMTLNMGSYFLYLNDKQINSLTSGTHNSGTTYPVPKVPVRDVNEKTLLEQKAYEKDPEEIFEIVENLTKKYSEQT